jgi:hypothetical protein
MATVQSRMEFLATFGLIPPEAWDVVHPQGPRISAVAKEYLYGQIVRDIAKGLPAGMKKSAEHLMEAGREMTTFAAQGLVAGWEEGDNLCPEWFKPFPRPHALQEILARAGGNEAIQAQDTIQTFASALRYISKNSQVKGIAAKLAGAVKELDSTSNVSAMRSAA